MPIGIVESAVVIAVARKAHSRNQMRKRRAQRRKFFLAQEHASHLEAQIEVVQTTIAEPIEAVVV